MCGSLSYLPPIVLPPRRAENECYVGVSGANPGQMFDFPPPLGKALGPLGAAWSLDLDLRFALGRFWKRFFLSAALLGAHVVVREPIFAWFWMLQARFLDFSSGRWNGGATKYFDKNV